MTVATASATTIHRIREIHNQPLPDLMFEAQRIHREHHDPRTIQLCTLGNIKSGACPEDCGYCSQSVHNSSGLVPEPLMQKAAVLEEAQAAKASGSTRFCMGAAWREVKDGLLYSRDAEASSSCAIEGGRTHGL
jgi:biotin synthase